MTPVSARVRLPYVLFRIGVYATSGSALVLASALEAALQPVAPVQAHIALWVGVAVEREISGDGADRYRLAVGSGGLARVVIEPRGVELRVRVFDSTDTSVVETDAAGEQGPIELELVATGASAFRFEIAPRYPRAAPGTYRIELRDWRRATDRDRRQFDARRQHAHALVLYRGAAYEQALSQAQLSLATREVLLGPYHPDVAMSLNLVGLIQHAKGDYRGAVPSFERALAIAERMLGVEDPVVADVLDNLARNHMEIGRFADAEAAVSRALGIRETRFGARHALTAASLRTLSDVYRVKGDYSKAASAADRAFEIAKEVHGPEELAFADSLHCMAYAQMRLGNYSSAEALNFQALKVRERLAGPDSLQAAESVFGLAGVYMRNGSDLKAEDHYRRALAIRERILGPSHLHVGHILNNLGVLAYRRRDYTAAEALHLRTLAITEQTFGPAHGVAVYSLNNLGLVYWRQGNYPKAAEFFGRGVSVAEEAYGPDNIELTSSLANLGIVLKESGDYEQAEKHYRRALTISEATYGKDHPQLTVQIESLGILYRDRGDYARAEPMFQRALEITERTLGPDHPAVARQLVNLTDLHELKGDLDRALSTFRRAIEIEEKRLPLYLGVGSERQKLAYFQPFVGRLDRVITFHLHRDPASRAARDLAAATILQRKARVLDAMADSLDALVKRSSSEARASLDRLRDLTSQLSGLVLSGPRGLTVAEHQTRIQTLTREREVLEEDVNRQTAGRYARTDPVTLPRIQAALPGHAALIEFVRYRPFDASRPVESADRYGAPRYAVYVIVPAADAAGRDLGPAAEIDEAIEAFRRSLREPDRKDVKIRARALDHMIMQPVRGLIGGASRLLISPDGQLALVPFEALVDERGIYLVEQFEFSYLSAGRDLLRMQVRRTSASAPVVIADPLFGEPATAANAEAPAAKPTTPPPRPRRSITSGGNLASMYFAPLAGTRQEARSIQSIFPDATVLAGSAATESAVGQLRAPRILHIATHGFFIRESDNVPSGQTPGPARGTRAIPARPARIENPLLRSGLALAGANLSTGGQDDGILTALEAAHLNLWGTKLVTLSACDTGVGVISDGDGVYGLRRSMFIAGAETLVMSLWPVSDSVTRELMTAYYRGLEAGQGRSESLRQVQLSMLKRKDREHPFYWSSFIQAGEWANLAGER